MHVLVTGASGFIGSRLLSILAENKNICAVGSVRHNVSVPQDGLTIINVGEISPQTDWAPHLKGIDVVVHTAARVHVMADKETDPLSAFRLINVEATLRLATQAAEAGVRRFVFLSSIKVNGESTANGRPYSAEDTPAPTDPYGISKMEAESGLLELANSTGMEVVIIRPVLVYGPGVKANFFNMMRWLDKGVPLPLGAINNRRSLVALDNLVDLIITCLDHPGAANQIFLVSDDHDLSTSDLLRKMAYAMNKRARLLPVPSWLLVLISSLLGKRSFSQRLCGSLQVDIAKTRSSLAWTPPISIDEALVATARQFIRSERK